jgi:hypothetical protein
MNDRSVKSTLVYRHFLDFVNQFFMALIIELKSEIKLNLLKIPGTDFVSDIAAQHGLHELIGQDLTGLGY